MRPAKSICSYVVWLLYALFICVLSYLWLMKSALGAYVGRDVLGVMAVCGSLLIVAALFALFRLLFSFLPDRLFRNNKSVSILGMLLSLASIGFLFFRVFVSILKMDTLVMSSDFWLNLSMVGKYYTPSCTGHGLTDIYSDLLHVMFLIFGNSPIVGIHFQIVLTGLFVVILSAALRNYGGAVQFSVATIILALSTTFHDVIFSLNPFILDFLFLSIGILWAGILGKRLRYAAKTRGSMLLSGFLLGLYAGFLFYLDWYNLVFLFFIFPMIKMKAEYDHKKKTIPVFASALAGFLDYFVILFILVLFINGESFGMFIDRQFFHFALGFSVPSAISFSWINENIMPVLLVMAFLAIPGFIALDEDHGSWFASALMISALGELFSLGRFISTPITVFYWSLCAGLGISMLILRNSDDLSETDDEDLEDEESEDDINDSEGEDSKDDLEAEDGIDDSSDGRDDSEGENGIGDSSDSKEDSEAEETAGDDGKKDSAAEDLTENVKAEDGVYNSGKKDSAEQSGENDRAKQSEIENQAEYLDANDQAVNAGEVFSVESIMRSSRNLHDVLSRQDGSVSAKSPKTRETSDISVGKTDVTQPAISDVQGRKTKESTVKPLDNPLPVPQKHIRKPSDYQHEVSSEDADFDFDISDTDDFDI